MNDKDIAVFEKKPNVLALIPAVLFGPPIGLLITGALFSLFVGSPGFLLMSVLGGIWLAYFLVLVSIPVAVRYQKHKENFIKACSIFGAILGAILGFPLVYMMITLEPGQLFSEAGLLAVTLYFYVVLTSALVAAVTSYLYIVAIRLLARNHPASS